MFNFFFFFLAAPWHMEFLGQGLNLVPSAPKTLPILLRVPQWELLFFFFSFFFLATPKYVEFPGQGSDLNPVATYARAAAMPDP